MNPYEVLNISENASEKEIKNSFRKLAKKYHPDKNSNNDAKLKLSLVLNAYESLKSNNFQRIENSNICETIEFQKVMDVFRKYEKEGMFDGDYSDLKKGQYLWNSIRKRPN